MDLREKGARGAAETLACVHDRHEKATGKKTHLVISRHLLLQYPLRVLLRLSRVYRERLSELDGRAELSCKDALLEVARRVVVVVIEADLAPSDAAGMGHGFEAVEGG